MIKTSTDYRKWLGELKQGDLVDIRYYSNSPKTAIVLHNTGHEVQVDNVKDGKYGYFSTDNGRQLGANAYYLVDGIYPPTSDTITDSKRFDLRIDIHNLYIKLGQKIDDTTSAESLKDIKYVLSNLVEQKEW